MTMRRTRATGRRGRGFTLIELLVVIAVIILLMAILLPVLQRSASQAREVQCLANVKQLGATIVSYSGNYKGFLPSPAHSDDAKSLNDLWDGDPNFPKSDDGPHTWKGKIVSYIGTADEDNPDQKYQLYKCPAVRLFKDHKSFYGSNAYLTMHVPEALRDKEGYFRMSHFDDFEQTSKTFLLGENNTGHWAVKPAENPREPGDFTQATDDAKCYARHLGRGSWVFADGHTAPMNIIENEKRHCVAWVVNKTEHNHQYPSD
jgi:prepilin-type N-terminal cleavage/methylation domain-containing protein/prepilin-type processing-associated H-X9-DG protein